MEDFIIENIKLVILFIPLDTCMQNLIFIILNCLGWFCIWKSVFKVLNNLTNGKYIFLNNVSLKVNTSGKSSRNKGSAKLIYKYMNQVSFILAIGASLCMACNTLCFLILNWISPFGNQFLPCLNWLLYADTFFIYFVRWILKNNIWHLK